MDKNQAIEKLKELKNSKDQKLAKWKSIVILLEFINDCDITGAYLDQEF